ncbi:hypothetical protein CBR_g971 [Chara braunii]|uniref:RNA-directed RNA polymerase n=1 Tax=Chara braunii TaxID=69332 RepID=A0A388KCR7_CHABU|nr:hypothetical protein CBR_g971 [Chara braunii]|eukprot:GBG67850.1 hypothetical protein CBR_g971 [Chara braunii]
MLGDINTFAASTTINNQLDTLKTEVQQLQSTNADGNNPKQYKMPTFELDKFDDYTHQDRVLWWEAFTTQLQILPVAKHAYIDALFMNSKGGYQIRLTHLAATHGVDVANLKDKISWEELTRLWKKRFIVDDAPAHAINRLVTMTQGNTETRDWLTEWQKIAATPDLDLPFPHLRREFYNRSCAALNQTLGDREQYATFAEIIDKAREIIKTNRAAAHEKSTWQPTYVEKVRTGPRQQQFAAVQSDNTVEDPAATQASREGDQVAAVQPRSNNKPRVPFVFDDDARRSFQALKTTMLMALVLSIYNPTLPTRVTTDASSYGIGAVLEQHDGDDWHPVEYFNHEVPPINSLDVVRKKELLALVMTLKRWRHFLLGRRRFTWVTDNNPLTYYKTQDTVSNTIGRWMYYIDQFDFTPKHLPGLSNRAADALSRRPDLCAMTHHAFAFDEELQRHFIRGYEPDPDFATLYAQLSSDHLPTSHYRIADGYLLLHWRGKDLLCVPRDRRLRTRLLGEYHDSRLAGHFRVNRTIARLRQRFRWPDLITDVTRYCDSCEVCRRSKPRNRNPYGELRLMPIPQEPGLSMAMDVIGPFPRDRLGHDDILTVVDRLKLFKSEIVTKTVEGRLQSKGFAKVTFGTEEAAERACLLGEEGLLMLMERKLTVKVLKRQAKRNPEHGFVSIPGATVEIGSLIEENVFSIEWASEPGQATVQFDFPQRKVDVVILDTCVRIGSIGGMKNDLSLQWGNGYQMDWQMDQTVYLQEIKLVFRFKELIRFDKAGQTKPDAANTVIFEACHPPGVYVRLMQPGGVSGERLDDYVWCSENEGSWTRTVDLTANGSIGRSLVYRVVFPSTMIQQLEVVMYNLEDFHVVGSHVHGKEWRPMETCQADNMAKGMRGVDEGAPPTTPLSGKPGIPPEVVFALHRLLQKNLICSQKLTDEFYELLRPSSELSMKRVLSALDRMHDGGRKEKTYDPSDWLRGELMKLWSKKGDGKEYADPGEGKMYMRRLIVTPTRVNCEGPEIELSNRVTRRFKEQQGEFLRVTFADEGFGPLCSHELWSNLFPDSKDKQHSLVYDRILSFLRDGIVIGSRRFEFLAFSASQLREQSVWFFASGGQVGPSNIRLWMGDFSKFRNIAKCAARMGQCFSSTTATKKVKAQEVESIPDVMTFDGRYCFSDGVGKISASFALEIATEAGILRRNGGLCPSAFQIRYGGSKGLVVVDPHSTFKLSLRPSMVKFDSIHQDLEVITHSKYLPCFLNRQIINILSGLGIPDQIFIELQDAMIHFLDFMIDDPEVALGLLRVMCAGQVHDVMTHMLESGFHPTLEPHLQVMLGAFRAANILDLRSKARMFVQKGRCLLGCMDETRMLAHGEVFIQVTCTTDDQDLQQLPNGGSHSRRGSGAGRTALLHDVHAVITGLVAVVRNPCLHPGDVRVLVAVDVPALHHIVDCVVFPQTGPRPHPNECSGGDLDGDLYTVIWDERLIPSTPVEPMEYMDLNAQELDRPIQLEDLQRFFVNHMINDNLGLISNAHTAQADMSPQGVFDPLCIELAKLFSMAVDYPKTGVPAVMPREAKPTKFPDFLEKEYKESYESEKILGILYRKVKAMTPQCLPETLRVTIAKLQDAYDEDLEYGEFRLYLGEAWACKRDYNMRLASLMNQFQITSEAEIVTGYILQFSPHYQKKSKEIKERVRDRYIAIRKQARKWFAHGYAFAAADDQNDNRSDWVEEKSLDPHEDMQRASAWYHVTYHPIWLERAVREGYKGDPLLSFAWVPYKELAIIKGMSRDTPKKASTGKPFQSFIR